MAKEQKTTSKADRKKDIEPKSGNRILGIRNKIVACFLVPIIFMVLIGVISYHKAEDGMQGNFRDSTMQTLNMAVEYVDMSCDFIEAGAMKYLLDANLNKYSMGLLKADPDEQANVENTLKSSLLSEQVANPFISQVHIVTPTGVDMLSTKLSAQPGILDEYLADVSVNGSLPRWIDRHTVLDKHMTSTESDYILAYEIMNQGNTACIVYDLKKSKFEEFLTGLDLGDGSIVGFVTTGGREIVIENIAENAPSNLAEGDVFAGQDFFTQSTEQSGYQDVKYNGKAYLYLYSKSNETGITICALVPEKVITGQAQDIKSLTWLITICAGIFVLALGTMIVIGIQKNMRRLSQKFGEVAKGDLTVLVSATGRDEFQDLAGSATHMIKNTKKLVNKVNNATEQLESSSHEVEQVSGVINGYSHDISQAIQDINEGMARQSRHAQECVDKTEALSDQIKSVSHIAARVEKLVSETEEMINQGIDIVHALGKRAEETTSITAKVGESLATLKSESEIINTFVATITDISTQTNLLSLNASIEAARAGEAGRGFSVVAEEIRHLADDSAAAAGEISNKVENISSKTLYSVQSAKEAQSMVALQTEAVDEVVKVFQDMQSRMNELVAGLREIAAGIESTDREREDTMNAVKNITDIIEETANNAEAVNEVAEKLQHNVENLNRTADVLGENMEGLKSEIAQFKI